MTVILTVLAMVAFAANSVLCRLALGNEAIDPWSFTALRIATGALALWLLTSKHRSSLQRELARDQPPRVPRRDESLADWKRAVYLLLYALPFSLAYVELDAGTGALLLFGAVQLTMIVLGIRRGERPTPLEFLALGGAMGGMVYFVLPGVSAPEPLGAGLMVTAGIGWGLYTMAGKKRSTRAPSAVMMTADAFRRAAYVIVPATSLAYGLLSVSSYGLLLAAISGSLTSGIGYVIWYAALRQLTMTRAALVQLSVPIIAAVGGVAFLGEEITGRLVTASVVILGSIALGVTARKREVSGQ